LPPSMMAMQELVVPRSMPMIFPMMFFLVPKILEIAVTA
jgi:hypothetical protein